MGLEESLKTMEKRVRLNHHPCALKGLVNKKLRKNRSNRHFELGERRSLWVPNLYSEEQPLINISSGLPATQESLTNAKSFKDIGEKERKSFLAIITSYKETESEVKSSYLLRVNI